MTKLITTAPQEMLSGQDTGISMDFHLYYNYAKTKPRHLATRHVITRVTNMKR
jgi:hypothetical protein